MSTKKSVKSQKSANTSSVSLYIRRFWIAFAALIAAVVLLFLLASWGLFGKLPTFDVLENPQTNLATEVISSDGKTLGKYYLNDNRTPVSFDELPDHLVNALIATEDERYYSHSGIDAWGTLRAVLFLGTRGGASTISQQLAKQLFTDQVSSNKLARGTQKIKEWIIAVQLERQYTKEEIIAMYFNIYDFNNNADGIRSAARIYFRKEPSELTIEEAAVLVGMFKNSSLYNPRRNPEGVINRRNVVLGQMAKNDFITEEERDSLQAIPLDLNYTPETHSQGLATYFREYLRDWLKQWSSDPSNKKPDGESYNIYLDGLKIYTTIDSRMQAYAEKAVEDHMKRLQAEFFVQQTDERNPTAPFLNLKKEEIQSLMDRAVRQSERWRHMKYDLGKDEDEILASFKKPVPMEIFTWDGDKDTVMTPLDSIKYYKYFLRTGMMSMQPETGFIKAWVGGVDYRHFKYDQVKQAKRQAGSTFKPFVYTVAIDQLHLSPCDKLPDVLTCIEANKYGNMEAWCPENSNGDYSGENKTLKEALANSVNSITARLMDMVGPQPVVNLIKKMGVESDVLAVPSIGLGTPDISIYEMVGAYGTFANQGVYVKPIFVTRIEDKYGTVLYEAVPETRDVLSEEVAYTAISLMKGVTESGSGMRLRHSWAGNQAVYKEVITGYPYEFTNPIAGKTGTTQNHSDGWFMGMVPNLVTGVWVGGEDRATHFASLTYGQGATMALPIWALYMKQCYADEDLGVSKEDFERPEELSIRVDCSMPEEESDSIPKPKETIEIDF